MTTHSKWTAASAAVAALVASAILGALHLTDTDTTPREAVVPTSSATVSPKATAPAPATAAGYQRMFRALDPHVWGGADISLSVKLADGRRVWLYGDTLSINHGMVHSTAITQDGGTLHVSHAGEQLLPDGPTVNGKARVYWIETAQAVGPNRLAITAAPMAVGTASVWDFSRFRDQSRKAIATVDADGNVTFVRWAGWVPMPQVPHGADYQVVGPNHFTYDVYVHDVRLANGEWLQTTSQNHDGADWQRNADGSIRYSDYAPLFDSTDVRGPGWKVFLR